MSFSGERSNMTVYYILIGLLMGLAYPLCIYKPSKAKKIIYVSVVFTMMLGMSTFRYGIGNDYYNYRELFLSMMESGLNFDNTTDFTGQEPGYIAVMKLAELLGGDYIVLNFLTAFLTLFPAAYIICRYSSMPWLSSWLYLAVTFFYNCMNFTRQSIAAAIILLGYRFFRDRNHLGAVSVILIGSMFHFSVLIMLPVYFISMIKPSAVSLSVIGGAGIIVFIFSRQIITFLLSHYFTIYESYIDRHFFKLGLSPVFLIIPLIIAVITLAAYFMGNKDRSPQSAFLANLSFYNVFIWLFITKHFIVERLSLPLYVFVLISLPDALTFFKEHFSEKASCVAYSPAAQSKGTVVSSGEKKKLFRAVYPSLTGLVVLSTFIYNQYSASERVHGVFPYRSVFLPDNGINSAELKKHPNSVFAGTPPIEFFSYATRNDYTIVALSSGNVGEYIDLTQRNYLKKLGFGTDFSELSGRSYVGVSVNGKNSFEHIGEKDGNIEESISLFGGKYAVSIVGTGKHSDDKPSVTINGYELITTDDSGLLFVVFDNNMKIIAAVQGYDFSAIRTKNLRNYSLSGIHWVKGFEEYADIYADEWEAFDAEHLES